MADEWELANLEQQVTDLEGEKEQYRQTLRECRNMIAELSNYIEDYPALDRRVEELLNRLPR